MRNGGAGPRARTTRTSASSTSCAASSTATRRCRSNGHANATSTAKGFPNDLVRAIVADGPDPDTLLRDRVALRLLLTYGLRKGALKAIQFRHFDHYRKRLTIFTKGEKIRDLPIPEVAFWFDLERLIIETEARPTHYLLQRQLTRPSKFDPETRKAVEFSVQRFPEQPMGAHGLHDWWYRCLERAGVVAPGTTSGERMHEARYTAGQRVLDVSGNLKATQKLLGHASIQTTGDIYTDWDSTSSRRPSATFLGRIRDRSPRFNGFPLQTGI
jgi:integrase